MRFKDYLLIALFVKMIDKKINLTFENTYCWACKDDYAINIAPKDFQGFSDLGFVRHIKTHHHFKEIDNYSLILISVLHEIGHLHTPRAKDDIKARAYCSLFSPDTVSKHIEIQNIYYNIPSEYAATEWAIQFIKKNNNFVKLFDKKFFKIS